MRATADIAPSRDADELIDFTCATPWERLALDVELELRAWGLSDGATVAVPVTPTSRHIEPMPSPSTSSTSSSPALASSRLALGSTSLRLELRESAPAEHWLLSSPLERIFSLGTHLTLVDAAPDGIVAEDPSAAAVLLSALTVAAAACGCRLPLLVPVGRPSSMRFVGRSFAPTPTRLSCDFTSAPAPQHNNVSGLLALFRAKRAAARRRRAPPHAQATTISAHFSYTWTDYSFRIAPQVDGIAADRRLVAAHAASLAENDPIKRLRLSAVWDRFPAADLDASAERAAMPVSSASTLRIIPSRTLIDALQRPAPRSRAPVVAPARQTLRLAQRAMQGRGPDGVPAAPLPLVDIAKSLALARLRKERTPIAPPTRAEGMSPRFAPAPAPTALDGFLAEVSRHITLASVHDDRLDEEFIISSLAALFEMDLGKGIMVDVVDALGPNAAEMDLLERVARLAGAVNTLASAQKLWNLFLDGIEVHWEMLWLVIGVPFSMESGPDHNESLVVQKLQMINCCVERVRREKTGMSVSPNGGDLDGLGRKAVLQDIELVGSSEPDSGAKDDEWLQYDRRVWEPYVQPHPLVTRDMVEEELQRMVMRAENSGQSDETEAKRQSLTLQSDMSAFKAANPDASLADFVRWFSPSDWIADEDKESTTEGETAASTDHDTGESTAASASGEQSDDSWDAKPRPKGRLSARMSREGNVWEELWRGADAVCASEQVPLFDAAAHGHKALADLRAMELGDVLAHLSLVIAGSTTKLLHAAFQKPPTVQGVEGRIEQARLGVREACARSGLALNGGVSALGELSMVIELTAAAEHSAMVAQSMLAKLPAFDGAGEIADSLATGHHAEVSADTDKSIVVRTAGLDGGWRNTLLPDYREFVIAGDGEDRMYAKLGESQFRVGFRIELDYSM